MGFIEDIKNCFSLEEFPSKPTYRAVLFGDTAGYFEKNISKSMLGVRTQADKNETKAAESTKLSPRKLKLDITATLEEGAPLRLRGKAYTGEETVEAEVFGDEVQAAQNAALTSARVCENLGKLGASIFEAGKIEADVRGSVMVQMSAINAARRTLCEKLTAALTPEEKENSPIYTKESFALARSAKKSAYFVYASSVTEKALGYFDEIFLPLDEYLGGGLAGCENVHPTIGFT